MRSCRVDAEELWTGVLPGRLTDGGGNGFRMRGFKRQAFWTVGLRTARSAGGWSLGDADQRQGAAGDCFGPVESDAVADADAG
jgi:hypothetical protein